MNVLAPVLRRFSPGGSGARLTILIFHRVYAAPDAIFAGEPDAAWFDRLMAKLNAWFNVMPLDEAAAMLGSSSMPERAAAITFDDGYEDNFSVAMPILRRHRMCATFFIATRFLDGGRMWNDSVIEAVRYLPSADFDLSSLGLGRLKTGSVEEKRSVIDAILKRIKYLPVFERAALAASVAELAGIGVASKLMMTSDQVCAMSRAGMQIGAHTISHPILAGLDDTAAEAEILGSKQALEGLLGKRVGLFAYPNGRPGQDYMPKDVAIVRKLGFDAAVSTHAAAVRPDADRFQLSRFTPWDRSMLRFGARLVRSLASG